ncbi:hypothetical protein B0A50_03159 [Salinomyces thailandicus]|uniref:Nuclear speckle splicing regulatory protein 1 N-terminal domain-containing protein n=1 Tax=Salinomyces thailandicus TaxID=706561 RepID=A0A4U0U6H8_9PEZI|nr:hypothetical protein B0A50_03159 [Salinomyces thailandica]
MSLKYGLNIKKSSGPPVPRRQIFDEDEEDDGEEQSATPQDATEEITTFGGKGGGGGVPRKKSAPRSVAPPPTQRKPKPIEEPREDLSSAAASRQQVRRAEELDASIFDYDSFHDAKTTVSEAKKEEARKDAVERKPKYIDNLLDAAARRKQDQLIAREKLLQKEREAEGDEFADKEKFVTGAYKQQQEEARRLEEEEKKKQEEDDKRKRTLGGGMQSFYRSMIDQTEQEHAQAVQAAELASKDGGTKASVQSGEKVKTDAELAAELKAKGLNVHINEEGQVTDKRELLSAGLNVAPSGRSGSSQGAEHLRSKPDSQPGYKRSNLQAGSQQAQRERQSRMMEEQLAAQAKRAREEEDEERARLEKAAKSQKTDKDVGDAKARYLARKAAKERGEG